MYQLHVTYIIIQIFLVEDASLLILPFFHPIINDYSLNGPRL